MDSLEALLAEVIGPFVSPIWRGGIWQVTAGYALSEREAEVMALLLYGRSVERIATMLFVSPCTVKCHRHNLYSKLEVHSAQELLDLFEQTCRESVEAERAKGTCPACPRHVDRRQALHLVPLGGDPPLRRVVRQ